MNLRMKSLLVLLAATATLGAAASTNRAMAGGRGSGPIIYVTGQGLFYDSIVLTDLPQHGPFQLLEMDGPSGLQTEFGPRDREYVGGRWWVDVNEDGEMDSGDDYFLCPLLPPGRPQP